SPSKGRRLKKPSYRAKSITHVVVLLVDVVAAMTNEEGTNSNSNSNLVAVGTMFEEPNVIKAEKVDLEGVAGSATRRKPCSEP
ncbi:hypothetical protein U1Q18_042109, partial [Sarracenia purpurea var. burkii]